MTRATLSPGHTLLTIPGAFDATEGAMTDVAFSPDGTLLPTADAAWEGVSGTWLPIPPGPTVRLWDAATGALLATLDGHEGAAWCSS